MRGSGFHRRARSALGVALLLAITGPSLGLVGADGGGAQDDPLVSLFLHCDDSGPGDAATMEAGYLEEGCWGHVGHHTFLVGRDRLWRLYGGSGRSFVTEQQLSPPVEGFGLDPDGPGLDTPVVLEVSMDGLSWGRIQDGAYTFVDLQEGIPSPQDVHFDFTADGITFRYLRVRMPLSAAHGLSGYIDHTELTLDVRAGPAFGAPRLEAQEGRPYDCLRHILEDVWDSHPCTFGGVEHWDSPSFFHTYPLQSRAELDRIQGSAVLAYFRPDDPGGCCGQTLLGVLDGELLVQVSANGVDFTTVATLPTTYGTPVEFDVQGLGGTEAEFVRLASGKHPGYWNHPALKHPEAYMVFSELSLSGMLPEV